MWVSKLLDSGLGYDCLDLTPNSKAIKVKISKRYNIKLKSTKKKERKTRQPAEWEKMFLDHISDDGLISKIHKELI